MRTGDFFADGVRRKFNMPMAKEAGHFQEIGLAQSDCRLALWTRNGLASTHIVEPDVSATGRTGHLDGFRLLPPNALKGAVPEPKPEHRRIAAQQQINGNEHCDQPKRAARQMKRIGESP